MQSFIDLSSLFVLWKRPDLSVPDKKTTPWGKRNRQPLLGVG